MRELDLNTAFIETMKTTADIVYFYSLSDEDIQSQELVNFFIRHLKALANRRKFSIWCPQEMESGKDIHKETLKYVNGDQEKNGAPVVLLLHDVNLVNTIYEPENEVGSAIQSAVQSAMQRQPDLTCVLPILIGSASYQGMSYQYLDSLTFDGKPLSKSQNNLDVAASNLVEQIERKVDEIKGIQTPPPPEPQHPYIFTYFCGREEQTDPLREALKKHRELMNEHKRLIPLVCVVHGDVKEQLESYKQRLIIKELNQLFAEVNSFWGKQSVLNIDLPWQQDAAHFETGFAKKLSKKIKPNASLEKTLKDLVECPRPVMLCHDMGTQDWKFPKKQSRSFWNIFQTQSTDSQELPESKIEKFFEFWNTLPIIEFESTPDPFLVFLFFTYKDSSESPIDEERNQQPRDYFLRLNFKKYKNLYGVVLPELLPVIEEQVKNWIRDEDIFAEFCRKHIKPNFKGFCNPEGIDKMISDIGEMYSARNAKYHSPDDEDIPRIPMITLKDLLPQKLIDNCCEYSSIAHLKRKSV